MADRASSFDELFDAAFLESVAHLRIVAGRVPRGGRFAEQRSRDLGHGIEFRDFRPYASGDDLRAIDWNIYRRLGRVFLRLFEELEDLPLYILPDVSKSAFVEDPPRARAGLRCALALATISLGQHDTVGVFPFSEDLDVLIRPQSGKNRVMTFARQLATIQPGGATDFAQAAKRLGGMRLRRGLVVVISDFFDPGGLPAVLEALGSLRHDLLLVQLVRDSDREVAVEGDLRLTDCESGAYQDVSVTPAVLERYRAAYDRFQAGLAEFARERSAGLLRLDVLGDVVPQLAELFESGRYAV
jgi:uncharacterized protein (DUF58 family)